MKKRIVEVLEIVYIIPFAVALCVAVIVCLVFMPLGILLEDLSCWLQKKADRDWAQKKADEKRRAQ